MSKHVTHACTQVLADVVCMASQAWSVSCIDLDTERLTWDPLAQWVVRCPRCVRALH